MIEINFEKELEMYFYNIFYALFCRTIYRR